MDSEPHEVTRRLLNTYAHWRRLTESSILDIEEHDHLDPRSALGLIVSNPVSRERFIGFMTFANALAGDCVSQGLITDEEREEVVLDIMADRFRAAREQFDAMCTFKEN